MTRMYESTSRVKNLTWMSDEILFFELITDTATATAGDDSIASVSSSSSEEDEEIVWENSTDDDCSCGTKTAAAMNIESQLFTAL